MKASTRPASSVSRSPRASSIMVFPQLSGGRLKMRLTLALRSAQHRRQVRIALLRRPLVRRALADAGQVGADIGIGAEVAVGERAHGGERKEHHDIGGGE